MTPHVPLWNERTYRDFTFLNNQERLLYTWPQLTRESVVLDLGAYHGDWSAAILHSYHPRRLVLIEPVYNFASIMKARFQDYPLVEVYQVALGPRDCQADLLLSDDASRLVQSRDADEPHPRERINMRDAAKFLQQHHLDQIDLCKINIEGSEYDLLDYLASQNLLVQFTTLLVQFHDFIPEAASRYENIAFHLAETHTCLWRFPFVWEAWQRNA